MPPTRRRLEMDAPAVAREEFACSGSLAARWHRSGCQSAQPAREPERHRLLRPGCRSSTGAAEAERELRNLAAAAGPCWRERSVLAPCPAPVAGRSREKKTWSFELEQHLAKRIAGIWGTACLNPAGLAGLCPQEFAIARQVDSALDNPAALCRHGGSPRPTHTASLLGARLERDPMAGLRCRLGLRQRDLALGALRLGPPAQAPATTDPLAVCVPPRTRPANASPPMHQAQPGGPLQGGPGVGVEGVAALLNGKPARPAALHNPGAGLIEPSASPSSRPCSSRAGVEIA